MTTQKLYAGIGPRKTPYEALLGITDLASMLASNQWKLKSGHGKGADQSFEAGHEPSQKEIWLPDDGFNGAPAYGHYRRTPNSDRVIEIARDHHPGYDRLSTFVQRLFHRNVNIILGENADAPVSFVAYWHFAENDINTFGGTNHSLRIARTFKIPMFNLNIQTELFDLLAMVNILNPKADA